MRPIDPDEFVDSLDFTDRQNYCRSWGTLILRGKVERVTDRLFNAAFAAIREWNSVPTNEPDRSIDGCVCGIFRVIRQGITERAFDAKRLVGRAACFCLSENSSVAAAAIRQFEPGSGFPGDLPFAAFAKIAIPKLRSAALRERENCQTVPMSVRGLAFHVLYKLDSSVLFCRELRDARFECAQAYFKWAAETQ
jgi:hypothetical protein